jgi:hypothetical protein
MINVEDEICRPSQSGFEPFPLRVVILHTSPELTRAAIRIVEGMTGDLSAEAVLMAIHIVPYPLPLERPSIPAHHLLKDLENLAKSSTVPLRIQLVLARDRVLAIRGLLPPSALVVLAAKWHWWRTEEDRLARALVRDGHHLIFLNLSHKECMITGSGLPSVSGISDLAAGYKIAAPHISE